MIQIALCDDSSYMRKVTKESLIKYSMQKNIEIHIQEYESGEMLLEAEKAGQSHDLIFIDYEFEEKGENGISIIRKFREMKKHTKVIFLSSYPQVVFQSFEVEAFRFLVKPLEEEKLFKAMDDFINLRNEEHILEICIEKEKHLIQEECITYIEGFGKNSILHFSDGRKDVMSSETLSTIEGRISKRFFRCHKSFLVNMEHVDSYSRTELTLDTGEKILLGRTKYKEFAAALTDYISKKRGI